MFVEKKIVIMKIRKPAKKDINEELQWFGNSLGLFGERDKDKSCYRVFVELLKNAGKEISSDEIAYQLGLSRSAVVHHLNNLMKLGIIVSEKNRYLLRVNKLQELIDELREDLSRLLDDLKETAREIDEKLGRK